MVGIVLEQHPERTQLFMQWQGMSWPIMVDPLNLLGLEVVPVTLLIDEEGIVRFRGDLEHLEEFLAQGDDEGKPKAQAVRAIRPDLEALQQAATTPEAMRRYADALVLWGGPEDLRTAITAYGRALEHDAQSGPAQNGPIHFHLGVAHRQRYDTDQRQPEDFQKAVEHWGTALDINPNQYIWRRRIQQYGPRLSKPYPFYDWVETARREIVARGEVPTPLTVEPRGAELAQPVKSFEAAQGLPTSPDPEGRIRRDLRGYIHVEQTSVPATLEPGGAARIHVVFRPNEEISAHWNNEAEDLVFWLDPPPGWQTEQSLWTVPNPKALVSEEERRIEVEVQSPKSFQGTAELPGYALYYVCEDVKGTCLYRRQDVVLNVRRADPPPSATPAAATPGS